MVVVSSSGSVLDAVGLGGGGTWGAGGMVDNLGTILFTNIAMGLSEYRPTVEAIFDWLNSTQDPATGLWGKPEVQGLNGMINGTYHLMRGTFFLYDRPFKFAERIIDSILQDVCFSEQFNSENAEGCQDLDHYYLLEKCHVVCPNYRRNEVVNAAQKRFEEILRLTSISTGGFSFEARKSIEWHNYIRLNDGQKEADLVGTVFYLQTLLSLSKILGERLDLRESLTHG